MNHYHESVRDALQAQLNNVAVGGTVQLNSSEYPGPYEIRKSMTLDGRGATLWELSGPLLTIKSGANVHLKNLKIEVNGDPQLTNGNNGCAILVEPGAKLQLQQVEVYGTVVGLDEVGIWCYPKSLYLGQIQAGEELTFVLRIIVAAKCTLSSEISGLSVHPNRLTPGRHEVRITLEKLRDDVLLRGRLLIDTGNFKRWMVIHAHALQSPSVVAIESPILWEPEGREVTEAPASQPPAITPPMLQQPPTLDQSLEVSAIPEPPIVVPQHSPVITVQPNVTPSPNRKRVKGQQIGSAFTTGNSRSTSSVLPEVEVTNSLPQGTENQSIAKQPEPLVPIKPVPPKPAGLKMKPIGLGSAFTAARAESTQSLPSNSTTVSNDSPASTSSLLPDPVLPDHTVMENTPRPKDVLGSAFSSASASVDSVSGPVAEQSANAISSQAEGEKETSVPTTNGTPPASRGFKMKPISSLFRENKPQDGSSTSE